MIVNNEGVESYLCSHKDTNLNGLTPTFEFEKISINGIQSEAEKLIKESGEVNEKKGLFEIQTANEVIEQALNQPDPVQLYSPLILENEIVILFADTGVGKTVLSFQMAIDISKKSYNTLYLDLELSKKQFQKRYTSDENGKPFILPHNLYRVGFARLKKVPKGITYEDYFLNR